MGHEVERRHGRAPEGEPPAGERLRAGAVRGGEEGDDGAEDRIGEATDEIEIAAGVSIPGRCLLFFGS